VIDVKRQVKMPVYIKEKEVCSYWCDFVVVFADNRIEYHDVKGFKTPVYKLKKKLIEAFYGITIKEL
jgi:hypothetical protein